MKPPLVSALTTNGRESWQLALSKESYFGYLSAKPYSKHSAQFVGRPCGKSCAHATYRSHMENWRDSKSQHKIRKKNMTLENVY
jgi:hypothetical protein